jgi:hypothetical protein
MVYARCACIIIHATPRCKTINLSMSKSILCSPTHSPSLCALRKNIVREADNKHTFSICTLRVQKKLTQRAQKRIKCWRAQNFGSKAA